MARHTLRSSLRWRWRLSSCCRRWCPALIVRRSQLVAVGLCGRSRRLAGMCYGAPIVAGAAGAARSVRIRAARRTTPARGLGIRRAGWGLAVAVGVYFVAELGYCFCKAAGCGPVVHDYGAFVCEADRAYGFARVEVVCDN